MPVAPPSSFPRRRESTNSPAFLVNHLESRHALPPEPAPRAEVARWVRPVGWEELNPEVALLLAADALPPGVMPLLRAGVPVSTMHWQVNLLTPVLRTRDGWWLLRSTASCCRGRAPCATACANCGTRA